MKKTAKKLLFILAFLLFTGIAAFSGYKIYGILGEYRAGKQTTEAMQQYVVMTPERETEGGSYEATTAASETEMVTEPAVLYPIVDFDALRQINSDVVGWIYIEDTNINYPIVQGTDNSYYVNHMVDGKQNIAGSIFMDYQNASDFSDPNTVLYGHNMKNKSMFAHITEYKNPAFFEAHSMGKLMTPTGNFQLQVIGGYVAALEEEAWRLDFETDEDFLSWLQDTMKKSNIGGSYEPEGTERILTLSTCDYVFEDARFVLVCKILN